LLRKLSKETETKTPKEKQTKQSAKSEIKPKDWPLYGQSLEYPHQSIGYFYAALDIIQCPCKPKSAFIRNLHFHKNFQ